MRALSFIFAVAVTAVACLAEAPQATAEQINYPWCTSGAGQDFGANNCGFSTFEQCLASARGNGQSCGPNPFYEPPAARPTNAGKPAKRLKNTSR